MHTFVLCLVYVYIEMENVKVIKVLLFCKIVLSTESYIAILYNALWHVVCVA